MARLTITAHARADLQEIHPHIAKDKPEAARRFVERLRAKARQLAETPRIGRSRSEDLPPICSRFRLGSICCFTASSRVESCSYASSTAAVICLRSFSAIES